jgi:hypothetical protein
MSYAKKTNGEVELKLQTTYLDIKLRPVVKFTFRPLFLPGIELAVNYIRESVGIIVYLEVVMARKNLASSRNNKLVFQHVFDSDIPPVFGAQLRAGNWYIYQPCFIK